MHDSDAAHAPTAPEAGDAVALSKAPIDRKTSVAPPAPSGGVKETLESILVAFILAFIFRAFVVEAFVIPTGSMAPTLLGAHMRYTCPECGYHFDGNYSPPSGNDDTDIPDHAIPTFHFERQPDGSQKKIADDVSYEVYCPNCGLRLPRQVNPPVYYGDRILVLKYLYLLHPPQRWDVVVFKSPTEVPKYNYSQNYIKRLTGKPGESVMVLDGDIYVAQNEKGPYVVQTKTRSAQQALWRIIYDNDFHPTEGKAQSTPDHQALTWAQPWRFFDGTLPWDTGDAPGQPLSRSFTFKGPGGSGTLEFDPSRNRPSGYSAFSDWLPYDQTAGSGRAQGENTVRDLKLQLDYSRLAGTGPLRLRLTKYEDAFIAEFTPTAIKLIHQTIDGKPLGEKSAPLPKASGPLHIEFTNVDYHVAVRVNDVDVLATTPEDYHPNLEWLRSWDERGRPLLTPPHVSITGDHQECRLDHISLWRDIYYTPRDSNGSPLRQGSPGKPVHLGPDEYFVCGDNSVLSSDARYWWEPINLPDESLVVDAGRVPGRFLLGKAFFVYWPAGFRPSDRLPGLIPNFSEMRFIR